MLRKCQVTISHIVGSLTIDCTRHYSIAIVNRNKYKAFEHHGGKAEGSSQHIDWLRHNFTNVSPDHNTQLGKRLDVTQ